ncbi:Uncharacterised protein [Serratia ficaria]|uniref:DUF4942 domain-containing protein n=1 Tax=Serratia ficaria TaxID=61651 RepID=UPI002182AE12|nr:DUF4942 domain-containing protein [Serratia ficaria]CAI2533717.1 Uncharacterised protein [Serratia ficaria]
MLNIDLLEQTHALVSEIDIDHGQNRNTDIIPSVAIDRIIAQRNEGVALYLEGLATLNRAGTLLKSATAKDYLSGFDICVHDAVRWSDKPERIVSAIKKLVDAKIWDRLLNETGMYTLMSSKQHDEWDRQLEGNDMQELTLETVLATFKQLNATKLDTFEQGIIDVFRALSWDYKTNNPCKIGKKIIVSRLLDVYRGGYITVSHTAQEKLDDLAKPFYLLDGKNVPDFRVGHGAQFLDHFNANGFSGFFDGMYFSVRVFKKGSAHITLKRLDLVDKLNDIVAKHFPAMLPPRV